MQCEATALRKLPSVSPYLIAWGIITRRHSLSIRCRVQYQEDLTDNSYTSSYSQPVFPFCKTLNALFIPCSRSLSLTTIPRASDLIALLPIKACRSCQPANSPATVCHVYISSQPVSVRSRLACSALVAASARLSSRSARGQRSERWDAAVWRSIALCNVPS